MAVFYEFISIVTRREDLVRASPRLASRLERTSSRAFGADAEILRLGFMTQWMLKPSCESWRKAAWCPPGAAGGTSPRLTN